MRLSDLHPNEGQLANAGNPSESVPQNPRTISESDFAKLKKSLRGFSDMLSVRPIVVDENGIILGGNMRYMALCKLRDEHATVDGYAFTDEIPEIWVKQVVGWSAKRKREFIIKDNQERGETDWDKLANEWDDAELKEWDVDGADWGQNEEPEPDDLDLDSEDKPFTAKLTFPDDASLQRFVSECGSTIKQQFGCTMSISGVGL